MYIINTVAVQWMNDKFETALAGNRHKVTIFYIVHHILYACSDALTVSG